MSFTWPEGKRAAVSFTFDDARLSQADRGLPLLNAMGIRATFYVSLPALNERLNAWTGAVRDGHEIGNHLVHHPCSGNFFFAGEHALEHYTLERMEREIQTANEEIRRLIGVTPATFAYPCGQTFVGCGEHCASYVPLVAGYFQAGRLFLSEYVNIPGQVDPAQLGGIESDGKSFEEMRSWVDRARDEHGWVVFAGHDTADAGPQTTRLKELEKIGRYCLDPSNGVWTGTVQSIAAWISGRRE